MCDPFCKHPAFLAKAIITLVERERDQTANEQGGGDDENEDELPRRQVTCRMRSMKTAEERRAQEGQDGKDKGERLAELPNC